MRQITGLIFTFMFVFSALVADDGCCSPFLDHPETSINYQAGGEDTHPAQHEGANCFNCVRCGSFNGLLNFAPALNHAVFISEVVEFYLQPYAPTPMLRSLKRPPITKIA